MLSGKDMELSYSKDESPDTVQMLRWYQHSDTEHLLAEAKWNGYVNVHVIKKGENKLVYSASFEGPITAVEWTKQGYLFAAIGNGKIVAIDLKQNQSKEAVHVQGIVLQMRMLELPNQEYMLFGMADNRIQIVSLKDEKKEFRELKASISAVDYLDGILAVGCSDESFLVCTLEELFHPNKPPPSTKPAGFQNGERICQISISPTKDAVTVCSTGGIMKEFKLGQNSYNSETLIKDSNCLQLITAFEYCPKAQTKLKLSASLDGIIRIWSSNSTTVPRNTVKAESSVQSVTPEISAASWSKDGSFIAYSIGLSWNQGIYSLKQTPYRPRTYIHYFQ